MILIRPATAEDQSIIRELVRSERLDPTSLNWKRFLVAEQDGKVVGIGQIKKYPGYQELGSLVVLEAYRTQGIGGYLIDALEERAGRPLYLVCQSGIQDYYARFGYEAIDWWEAPWMLKVKMAFASVGRLFGIRIVAMRKD